MTAYTTHGRVRVRRLLALIALAAPLGACRTPDELLSVTDPDIINPGNVASAAGADAVRLGALSRLNAATSGGTWRRRHASCSAACSPTSGTTAIPSSPARRSTSAPSPSQNNFLTSANRSMHRARLSAEQAIQLLEAVQPHGAGLQRGRDVLRAGVRREHHRRELLQRHHLQQRGRWRRGVRFAHHVTTATFERALAHADSGLALITGTTANDVKVQNALRVMKGRILLNLNRIPDAATAVGNAASGVPTTFVYQMLHSTTTNINQVWNYNNSARRYSVSTKEGGNGLDFATANDARLPICQGGDAICVPSASRRPRGTTSPRPSTSSASGRSARRRSRSPAASRRG